MGFIRGNLCFVAEGKNVKLNNNKEIWKNFSSVNGLSAFLSREKEVSFLFRKFKIRKH